MGPTVAEAYIVDAVRTPSGQARPTGAYAHLHPVDLLAGLLQDVVGRLDLDPAAIDDVIGGCVTQAGEQAMNTTRNAVLAAGFPDSVPATTVDRQCGSSQQAIQFAAQAVQSGNQDLVLACGVESMGRVPMWSNWLDKDPYGVRVAARYPDGLVPQGVAAEMVVARYGQTREQLDAFAVQSHQRAAHARASGWFNREMVPVKAPDADGTIGLIDTDQTIRATSSAKRLAELSPAFRTDELAAQHLDLAWSITAGNSSPLTDGAACTVIASERAVREHRLTPRARIHASTAVGDDPLTMLLAVLPATRRVLDRARLSISEVDTFEVNEAFACVPLAWQHEFGADPERVNPAGGAISLGHPLGASGARLMATMLSTLEREGGRYGLQTMCEAGGLANATIIERL